MPLDTEVHMSEVMTSSGLFYQSYDVSPRGDWRSGSISPRSRLSSAHGLGSSPSATIAVSPYARAPPNTPHKTPQINLFPPQPPFDYGGLMEVLSNPYKGPIVLHLEPKSKGCNSHMCNKALRVAVVLLMVLALSSTLFYMIQSAHNYSLRKHFIKRAESEGFHAADVPRVTENPNRRASGLPQKGVPVVPVVPSLPDGPSLHRVIYSKNDDDETTLELAEF